jgi:glycosyltransferase involved in cell wall biosynthesis
MINPLVTHEIGGVQRQLYLQSRALVQRGIRVSIIQRRDQHWTDAKAAHWSHVQFLEVPAGIKRLGVRGRGLVFVLGGLARIARRRHDISILHAHQISSPALVAVLGKRLCGIPAIAKVTLSGSGGEMAELGSLPWARFRRRVLQSLDRVLVLTDGMKQEVVAGLGLRGDQAVVIPNGVQTPASFPRTRSSREGAFNVLYAGRLSEQKSLDTLVKAAGLLVQQGVPAVEVQLVGPVFAPRDPMPKLRALIATLDPRVRVIFHGHQADVVPFYRRADVFVLPSQSEGMSNALLEAMAWGVCAVVSDIPENRVLIDHEHNGLLFAQGSVVTLASQLLSLYEDRVHGGERSSRLARAAYERVRDGYSIEAVGDRLIHVYQSVLDERGRRR